MITENVYIMMKKELNILKSKTHGKASNNKNW